MISTKLVHGVVRRGRSTVAQIYLTLGRFLTGRPFWVDHKWIKLPYHGDGDLQELYYHLDGREWWETESSALRRYVHDGNVVVDVGANLGFMSGILSTLTGSNGRVVSFEPSPSTYAKLLEVIAMNGYNNITPYNMGCGKEEQVMTLHHLDASGHATLRPHKEIEKSVREKQSVRIVKLDDFIGPALNRLDFVKIDTEGYEDEVLLGASAILKRFRPVIYIELCADYLASSERAITILRSLGYSFDREPDLSNAGKGKNFFALPPA